MKLLAAPPQQDFAVYVARPETRWCERLEDEVPETLYTQGFLPYSGARGLQNIFYSARSARVLAQAFKESSENRRIARRFDGFFTKERLPITAFIPDETFWKLCLGYFAHKHGPAAMPRERLQTILESPLLSTVVIYKKDGIPVAYVLEAGTGSMRHYWFSFYALEYAQQSLGLWLMLDCIRDAQAAGVEYYYLGTVYGEKALYKTNFSPLQWWDETTWSADTAGLKTRARSDS